MFYNITGFACITGASFDNYSMSMLAAQLSQLAQCMDHVLAVMRRVGQTQPVPDADDDFSETNKPFPQKFLHGVVA